MFRRVGLFLITNILVLVTITIVTSLLGVNRYMTDQGLNYAYLLAFCAIWGFGGAFISLGMSRMMAKWLMRVQVIDPAKCSSQEREIYELVARLSYRAGLKTVPEVGIYQSSDLNAFATGPSKKRSLVAVSSGLLMRMNKDEVEGVIAHELAHVANGDMVTMTLIQGVINSFVMFFARIVAFFASSFVRDDMRWMVNIAVTILLEILFSILGAVVVAWFSRLREFRADEGGARLAGRGKMVAALQALQRVYEQPLNNAQPAPESIAAFQISNRGRKGWIAMFSSHPPLGDRIQALKVNPNLM